MVRAAHLPDRVPQVGQCRRVPVRPHDLAAEVRGRRQHSGTSACRARGAMFWLALRNEHGQATVLLPGG